MEIQKYSKSVASVLFAAFNLPHVSESVCENSQETLKSNLFDQLLFWK
jgi:hypothetical protein